MFNKKSFDYSVHQDVEGPHQALKDRLTDCFVWYSIESVFLAGQVLTIYLQCIQKPERVNPAFKDLENV